MIKRDDFNPGIIELFLNSNYLERKELYRYVNLFASKLDGKILDFGCGTKPYEKFFKNSSEYIGLEINGGGINSADIFYDGKKIPFKDNEFDAVVSFQVLYQIINLEDILKEINRVLKKDAKLLVSVPFIWFDGGANIHRRFSEKYSKFIFEKFGFEILEIRQTNNNFSALCLLISKYIDYSISKIKNSYLRKFLRIIQIVSVTPLFNILGELFLKFGSKDNELYIDSVIYAKKVKNV